MNFDLKGKSEMREPEENNDETYHEGALRSWSAPEHQPYTVGRKFYLFSIIFLVALIIYALVYNSPIMAITFILIGIVGYLFLQKEPEIVNFSITHEGIIAGREIYEFDNLKSFWIFYNPPQEKRLSLRSKGSFTPYIHIPLHNEDPVRIRELLLEFIPEIKQDRTLVDAVERLLHK